MPVLVGCNKGLDHLSVDIVSAKLIQLVQPEVVALIVQRRLRRIIRVPSQIAVVLHQDKGAVEFEAVQIRVFGNGAQSLRSSFHARVQISYQLIALSLRQRAAGVGIHRVHELRGGEECGISGSKSGTPDKLFGKGLFVGFKLLLQVEQINHYALADLLNVGQKLIKSNGYRRVADVSVGRFVNPIDKVACLLKLNRQKEGC